MLENFRNGLCTGFYCILKFDTLLGKVLIFDLNFDSNRRCSGGSCSQRVPQRRYINTADKLISIFLRNPVKNCYEQLERGKRSNIKPGVTRLNKGLFFKKVTKVEFGQGT